MKINNKGYMLVEIIIAFSIAMGIAYYLLNLTYKFKNTNEDIYQSTIYLKDKIAITKNIMNNLEEEVITDYTKCDGNCIILTTETGQKKLLINENIITYGKIKTDGTYDKSDISYYEKELEKFLTVGEIQISEANKDYFSLTIPISSIYSDEDYEIKLFGQKSFTLYTVTYNANKFIATNKTENGVTISYIPDMSILTLNGTWTSTSIGFGKFSDSIEVNSTYNITLTPISGSYTTTASPYFVLDIQKNGTNYSDRLNLPSVRNVLFPATSSVNMSTITVGSNISDANGLYFWMWQSTANGTTFNNYQVKVNITKKEIKSIAYNSNYILPSPPTRLGYTFAGWYTEETGGSKVDANTKMTTTTDHTLYAHWN